MIFPKFSSFYVWNLELLIIGSTQKILHKSPKYDFCCSTFFEIFLGFVPCVTDLQLFDSSDIILSRHIRIIYLT